MEMLHSIRDNARKICSVHGKVWQNEWQVAEFQDKEVWNCGSQVSLKRLGGSVSYFFLVVCERKKNYESPQATMWYSKMFSALVVIICKLAWEWAMWGNINGRDVFVCDVWQTYTLKKGREREGAYIRRFIRIDDEIRGLCYLVLRSEEA